MSSTIGDLKDTPEADDDGQIFYPSGNLAVSITSSSDGKIFTFHPDTARFQVAAYFDCRGVGSVNHSNGRPWLVVTVNSWIVSDAEGHITESGKFPRKSPEPVTCEVSENLSFKFYNRQSISATFATDAGVREFQCGQQLRRPQADLYTNKVVSKTVNGRLNLDVDQIRQRQKDIGSVYVPKGPHHYITPAPGVGILKTLVKTLDTGSQVLPTIGDLDQLQQRLTTISAQRTPTSSAKQKSRPMPQDFGTPEMSNAQKKLWARTQAFTAQHTGKRTTLKRMPLKQVQGVLEGSSYQQDVLYVFCLLADWSNVCFRLEEQLQEAYHELLLQTAANPSGDAGHIQMFRVDASEGDWLQKHYDFRSVPMFFMAYDAKLVMATNNFHTAAQVTQAAHTCLQDGRRGVFLPSEFTFRGQDNSVLDYIKPGMSLLHTDF